MDELFSKSQDALRGFLHTELQLAPTLIETARAFVSCGNRAAALRSLYKAGEALRVVEHFYRRMPLEERAVILQSVAKLRANMDVVRRSV